MALLDTYCDADSYRARVGSKESGTNATLTAQLLGMSRHLEKELQLAPGAFNSATRTLKFDGNGLTRLWLRDEMGYAYFLQSISADGLAIDYDLDGDTDYAFDTADAWLRLSPANAVSNGEPGRAVELLPVPTAPIAAFPILPGCISITGVWGWSAVPGIIADLVAHLTHDLRIAERGGQGGYPAIDGSLKALAPDTFWMWTQAKQRWGRRLPGVI